MKSIPKSVIEMVDLRKSYLNWRMLAQIPGIQDMIKPGEPGWVKIRMVWRGESIRNYDRSYASRELNRKIFIYKEQNIFRGQNNTDL